MDILSLIVIVDFVIGAIALGAFWAYDRNRSSEAKAVAERYMDEAEEYLEQIVDLYDDLVVEAEHSEALQQELFEAAAGKR